MTTESEQLEAQSREAIKAWCDDPSVQLERKYKDGIEWQTSDRPRTFDLDNFYYRIAKPKKWYRVGKLSGGRTITADNDMDELSIKTCSSFIGWLDERKYYD